MIYLNNLSFITVKNTVGFKKTIATTPIMIKNIDVDYLRERVLLAARESGIVLEEEHVTDRALRDAGPEKCAVFFGKYFGRLGHETKDLIDRRGDVTDYMKEATLIDWFRPRKQYSDDELEEAVMEIAQGLGIGEKRPKVVYETQEIHSANGNSEWRRVHSNARDVISRIGSNLENLPDYRTFILLHDRFYRKNTFHGAKDAMSRMTRDSHWSDDDLDLIRCFCHGAADVASRDDSNCAGYYVLGGDENLKCAYPENPFEALIAVYKLGLWPAGIERDKLVIWNPPIAE